jgi:hypothetical protein
MVKKNIFDVLKDSTAVRDNSVTAIFQKVHNTI